MGYSRPQSRALFHSVKEENYEAASVPKIPRE